MTVHPEGLEKQESIKGSYTASKKQIQKSLQQNHRVWGQRLVQNGPWVSSRQVPEPPQAAPQAAQRRLQAASVTPVWLPQATRESLWLPPGTAYVPPNAILGAWGPQMSGFRKFRGPDIASKSMPTII